MTAIAGQETVVVGGGASGVLAALQLFARTDRRVTIVESGPAVGRGIAYRTTDDGHLLNSRAETMSAYADRPADFVEWCRRRGLYCGPAGYAPRGTYGRYLSDTMDATARASAGRLRIVRGRAVAVGKGFVRLVDGRSLRADDVVLALGHPPSPPRSGVVDAWHPEGIGPLALDESVVLIGTGLTAVDVLVTLVGRGHRGPVLAISRHGLLPRPHVDPPPRCLDPVTSAHTARQLLHDVKRAAAHQADWRSVVDGLRPAVQPLWAGLSVEEQARFLRHVSRLWEVHRHRMAPPIAAQLRRMTLDGRLRVVAGRVSDVRAGGVEWVPRGCTSGETVPAAAVVDCRGPGTWVEHPDPLARQLAATGATSPDPHRLGFATTAAGQLIGADGTPTPGLWTLGPTRRGDRYETTAIPEIRQQAAALADQLVARPRLAYAS
jgi:uncharacterized NAD(P)/FAD-binding protein YdhS